VETKIYVYTGQYKFSIPFHITTDISNVPILADSKLQFQFFLSVKKLFVEQKVGISKKHKK
jgi:hypothetical protein